MSLSSEVKHLIDPSLKPPVVLIQGLPGIGFVGKIAVDYLIEELHATKFAELYSPYLTMPDGNVGIHVAQDGSFTLPHYDFYSCVNVSPNLVLLTGNVQPISWGQYEVASKVLEFVSTLGCQRVIAIGGFQLYSNEESTRVYGVSNSPKLMEEFLRYSVAVTDGGAITGACGIILGLADKHKLESIGLLGVTRGDHPDMESAKNILSILSQALGFPISLKRLEMQIEEIKSKIEKLKTQVEIGGLRKEEDKRAFYV